MAASFSASQVTEFSQTLRSDGYDLVLAFKFDRTDGSSQEWKWQGQYFTRDWGIEWNADLEVIGTTAAALTSSKLPRRIEAKIIYGEPVGDMRGGQTEVRTTFQDGRQSTRTENRLFPAIPRDFGPREYLDTFRQIFEQQPFLGVWQGPQSSNS